MRREFNNTGHRLLHLGFRVLCSRMAEDGRLGPMVHKLNLGFRSFPGSGPIHLQKKLKPV